MTEPAVEPVQSGSPEPPPKPPGSSLGCFPALIFAVIMLSWSKNPGIGIMGGALFVAVWDLLLPGSAFPARSRYRLGVFWYVIGILSMLPRGCQATQIAFLLTGFFLAGTRPIIDTYRSLQYRMVSINADRWVDIFSLITMTVGVIIFAATAIGGMGMQVSYGTINIGTGHFQLNRLPALITMFMVGLAFFALGLGIRRRAAWAGALGLGLTFWGFADTLNRTIASTDGNLSHLPAALVRNSIGILFYWCFFFGFYKIFFPLVASKANELVGNLETRLRTADEALHDTRQKLNVVESQAASISRDLVTERTKLEALLETTNEGIALFDAENRLIYLNPAYSDLYEIKRTEWVGKSWKGILARPGIGVLYQTPETNPKGTARGEVRFRDQKGEIRKILAFYTKTVTDEKGEFLAYMGFSRDVTLEREIDRMKTEFVSNVSHELRTPLTSIRAYAEMLLDGEVENLDTSKDYLQIILDESERLTNLINDILDLSKMEAGKKTYRFATHDPAEILRKVASIAGSAADKKHQKLTCHLPANTRPVFCDVDLLHQAFLNLVNNAVKYTPPNGAITLSLDFTERGYRLSVTDTGQGISPEDQKKLFTKFFRVENSLNQEIGGTGLGLALVKNIAQVHQGTVAVTSEPGKGSTFTLALPLDGGRPSEAAAAT